MTERPNEPTDGELARRVLGGPEPAAAFDALYARHATRLLAYLRDRFPAHADDLAQEAWTRALGQMRKGGAAGMENFRAWLFRVAANAGIDQVRGSRAGALPDDGTPDARGVSALESMLDAERRDVFRGCLDRLDPGFRAVIAASSAGERPADTAARLGISRAAVDQRKSRGLAALRDCVGRRLPAEAQ